MTPFAPCIKPFDRLCRAQFGPVFQGKTGTSQPRKPRQPRLITRARLSRVTDTGPRGFFLGGHRLSRLFRAFDPSALPFMHRKTLRVFLAQILTSRPIMLMYPFEENTK
jgi:hypothetical protein